jgi:ketosteroid isomerase-like protein
VSEAFDVVQRFQSLMVHNLSEDEAQTPEHRLAQIAAMLAPDVVFRVAESLPYGGVFVGVDGFLAMGERFGQTWEILDGGRFHHVDAGDGLVIASVDPTFRSCATGRTVSFQMVEFITVRDGRISELVPYYFDLVPLLEAIGSRGIVGR